MHTKLLYMQNMSQHTSGARVVSITASDEKQIAVLDQTIFYPQGGGQPYDTGYITTSDARFVVQEVRFVDGVVNHIGHFEFGSIEEGHEVVCSVDIERRKANTRLHSIGHVIDMALKKLDLDWEPVKGYHFPEGPYVEYRPTISTTDTSELREKIETACNEIVSTRADTRVEFTGDISLETSKPVRIVYYGEFGIPCGGTHVENLEDIGTVVIRKIKLDNGVIRVSYC